MKFCPQCGTEFEPEARFCLECGFDKSTVEPVEPLVTLASGVVVTETVTSPVTPVEIAPSQPEVKPGCPQCGSILDTGDRFCQKCGFDTFSDAAVSNQIFKPVEQPEVIHRPESVYSPPVVEKVQSPISVQQSEPVIPPPIEPVRTQTPAYVPPIRTTVLPVQQKRKKPWLWIVLIIIGLGILGAAGWFGYKAYFDTKEETASDTIANMELPPISDIDTSSITTDVMEEPQATIPEQPQTTTKPLSKIDQELARQKTKEQNKSSQQTTTQTQKPKPELSVKASPNAAVNDNLAKVILEVGRKEEPKSKNPKNPTKLMIQKPTMLVRITTDHYNNGMGTPGGGTISIKDRDGNVIGTYKALGKKGKDGTPSAKWVVEPHKVLEKGTYFIWDSDMPTWSKTFVGSGFVIVEGYVVD